MDDRVRELIHKQEITEQIYRYSRGVDRMERALARACWHDDGTAEYRGMFEGDVDGLLDWMWTVHEGMQMHSHQMSNILIELRGEVACSGTYATVALRTRGEKPAIIVTRGRYFDRWSLRAGRWAIDHRIHVSDLSTITRAPKQEPIAPSGRRDDTDASYELFA
jgi:hypothetical protein